MRKEEPYEVPRFAANDDGPLLYVSFGSLGAGDTELLKRIIAAIGRSRFRALVNVGDYKDAYSDLPPNVIIDGWYPQPSVIPLTDAVIHHGGNNSFTECLYFGTLRSSWPTSGMATTTRCGSRRRATACGWTATSGRRTSSSKLWKHA